MLQKHIQQIKSKWIRPWIWETYLRKIEDFFFSDEKKLEEIWICVTNLEMMWSSIYKQRNWRRRRVDFTRFFFFLNHVFHTPPTTLWPTYTFSVGPNLNTHFTISMGPTHYLLFNGQDHFLNFSVVLWFR